MQNTQRISMAAVVASSAVSILLAAAPIFLLSGNLATATPNAGPGSSYGGDDDALPSHGLDLPMAPTWVGGPAPDLPPPPAPEQPDTDDNPRDTPPPQFFGEEIDAETDSILYVIDQSGSMSIRAQPFEDQNGSIVNDGSRLDRAKAELKKSIAGLPENFFFNVFFYDECVNSCWNSKQQASAANKQAAFGWIDAIQPDGWTNTGLAVQTALLDKTNKTVVLLSDGAPNFLDCAMNVVGDSNAHAGLIKSENTQGATVNTFGIGVANDTESRGFMQRVAHENTGTYTEVE